MFFIECIFDGIPTPSVMWLKDGVELNEVDYDKLRIVTVPSRNASQVEVTMASSSHDGNYTCVASNDAGNTSASVLVKISPGNALLSFIRAHMYTGSAAGSAAPIEVRWS